jgi:hypothetical protein
MTRSKTIAVWSVVIVAVLVAGSITAYRHRRQPVTLKGAVLRQDGDPNRQLPLADVEVIATNALGSAATTTDAAGFFTLKLPSGLRRRQQVVLKFRHSDYQPLDVNDFIGDKIYIARMTPNHQDTSAEVRSGSAVSNTRIRYSVKATTEADIGTAVKAFQVVNAGNVPCNKRLPCGPGNKWKATLGNLSQDAGEGNEFRNARVSCIAGPCPFTKVDQESLSSDRRHLNIAILNWSDTVTYLLEAEVIHPMTSDMVRETYPVIFGRTMNFSLPSSAEGPSIEAEVAGDPIVFPLGPDLFLRWADCQMIVDRDQSKNYRCELKPGYQFR